MTAQWIIIQSLDEKPERLCIGEVAVYVIKGQYATALGQITTALMLHVIRLTA